MSQRESRGGRSYFSSAVFSPSEPRAVDFRARVISLPAAVSQIIRSCRVFDDRVGVGVCIL